MHNRYELLLDNQVWIFYPKSRDGLQSAIDELNFHLEDGENPDKYRIVYSVYDADPHALVDPAHPAKLTQRYDVYDVDWGSIDPSGYAQSMDESMDGDFDSAMTSAGFGTDEDYGYFGDETYGAEF